MPREFEVDSDLDLEDDVQDFDVDLDETAETYELEDFEAMGINPVRPTEARPGTEQKVLMLSARYAAGMPLWHDEDCYDHGPRESELMGNSQARLPPVPQLDLVEALDED